MIRCATHAEVILKGGQVCLVSLEDADDVDQFGWALSCNGYAEGHGKDPKFKKLSRLMHRYILRHEVVKRPNMSIDHINGNKLDNRRENLRLTDQSLNSFRQRRPNAGGEGASGFIGVRLENLVKHKPWRASIRCRDTVYNLGRYATMEEALAARRAAEIRFFGEFSPLQTCKKQ